MKYRFLQTTSSRGRRAAEPATRTCEFGDNPGADKTAVARKFGTPTMDEAALRSALGLPAVVVQASLF